MRELARSSVVGFLHALAIAASLLVLGCGPVELRDVPAELIGTWRTDTPGYERSYLEIEPGRITIGMGRFHLYEFGIERIEGDTDGSGERIYQLHYTAEEGYPDKLVFVVDPRLPNTFRMGSRSQTWVRDS